MKTNKQRVIDAMLLILDNPDADTDTKMRAARIIMNQQTSRRAAKQKRSEARGQLAKFTKP